MDRPFERQGRKLLSVIVTKVEVAKWTYKAQGYFILLTIVAEGRDKWIDLHYLTPPERPFELVLPPWIFHEQKKEMDEISPRDVTKAIVKMLEDLPFEMVPPAPIDVPWHKIPPSKHELLKKKKRKADAEGPLPPDKKE